MVYIWFGEVDAFSCLFLYAFDLDGTHNGVNGHAQQNTSHSHTNTNRKAYLCMGSEMSYGLRSK